MVNLSALSACGDRAKGHPTADKDERGRTDGQTEVRTARIKRAWWLV